VTDERDVDVERFLDGRDLKVLRMHGSTTTSSPKGLTQSGRHGRASTSRSASRGPSSPGPTWTQRRAGSQLRSRTGCSGASTPGGRKSRAARRCLPSSGPRNPVLVPARVHGAPFGGDPSCHCVSCRSLVRCLVRSSYSLACASARTSFGRKSKPYSRMILRPLNSRCHIIPMIAGNICLGTFRSGLRSFTQYSTSTSGPSLPYGGISVGGWLHCAPWNGFIPTRRTRCRSPHSHHHRRLLRLRLR
jgi:hypothetical protein